MINNELKDIRHKLNVVGVRLYLEADRDPGKLRDILKDLEKIKTECDLLELDIKYL